MESKFIYRADKKMKQKSHHSNSGHAMQNNILANPFDEALNYRKCTQLNNTVTFDLITSVNIKFTDEVFAVKQRSQLIN